MQKVPALRGRLSFSPAFSKPFKFALHFQSTLKKILGLTFLMMCHIFRTGGTDDCTLNMLTRKRTLWKDENALNDLWN
jgi:hypothetical protein